MSFLNKHHTIKSRKKMSNSLKKEFNKIIYQDDKILKFLIESTKYGNYEVIIDSEDYDKVKNYRWCINFDYRNKNIFYIVAHNRNIYKRKTIRLHRIILNLTNSELMGDHKNHNTLDYTKINLRRCSHIENNRNRNNFGNSSSGYKGVHWHKRNKNWISHIGINYKTIHLGYFKNKIEAAKAYNQAAIKYFGEFAKLNDLC